MASLKGMTKAELVNYIERLERQFSDQRTSWSETISKLRDEISELEGMKCVRAYKELQADLDYAREDIKYAFEGLTFYLQYGAPRQFMDLPCTDRARVEYTQALDTVLDYTATKGE